MPTNETLKIKTKKSNLYLRVSKGHFATNHSHSNYYIDVVAQKSRLSEAKAVDFNEIKTDDEAKAVAKELCSAYNYNTTIVDTILCLDGTEVIGTCLADQLTKKRFHEYQRSPDNLRRHPRNDKLVTDDIQRQYRAYDSRQARACTRCFCCNRLYCKGNSRSKSVLWW